MKTLIILVHPNIQDSVINKRWIDELNKFPEKYHIHKLYEVYPNEKIDIEAEQKRIEAYDKIVFQFPLYWFSSPPLLKKWLDEVLTYGWAYGSQSGYKVSGKKIGFGISTGISESDYSLHGTYKYTLTELLRPFELTVEYIQAEYKSFFAYYDIEQNASEEWIEKSVKPYLAFLDAL